MSLTHHLNTLEFSGLVRLASAQPELEYWFRHALVQEAAYETLVKSDRAHLHLAVGEAMEAVYPDRREELAPVLAGHFHEAGDRRALGYFVLAGDAAARRYAHTEAIGFLTRALEIARRPPSPLPPPPMTLEGGEERGDLLTHLFSSLGRELELSARHADAVRVYLELEAAARERGDRAMELEAMIRRATVLVTPSGAMDSETGAALCERALALARELGDRAAEARVLWNLMLLHSEYGNVEAAVGYGEASLAIARALNLRGQAAYTLNDLSGAFMYFGRTDRAAQALDEARHYWAETGNRPMLADNLGRAGLVKFMDGRLREALALSEESLTISRSIGNRWGESFAMLTIGWARQVLGEVDESIRALDESIRLSEQGGFAFPRVGARVFRALMYADLGDPARGVPEAEAGLDFAREAYPTEHPSVLVVLARLHVRLGDLDLARRELDEAHSLLAGPSAASFGPDFVELAEAEWEGAHGEHDRRLARLDEYLRSHRFAGQAFYRPLVLRLVADSLRALGRADEARAALLQARDEAEARQSRFALWPILAALADLESARGHAPEAETARAQAREVVEFIAAHCPPDLRETFLNSETVKEVMGGA